MTPSDAGERDVAVIDPQRCVLLVNADESLSSLLGEWLTAERYAVVAECDGDDVITRPIDLIIVDVPFPRQGGLALLQQVARQHPNTPAIALSPTFFAGIDSTGAVARQLGVASVCPMPVTQHALIAAVRSVLQP